MILAIGCWIFLFILCQSKHIEVNNEGNNSSSCCLEGTCLCGSLYKALLNVESDTVVNITSSFVTLHNVTHMGSGYNNITIIGNGTTVACNDSGILDCFSCSNVVIKGITWDHCGDPKHPSIYYAISFGTAVNISIISCTFQHSKVCIVVLVNTLPSGFLQVHDSRFFNHVVNLSRCTGPRLYASLLIYDSEYPVTEKVHVSISRTLFYHNGPYRYFKNSNSYVMSSAAILCYFRSPRPVKLDVESVTVSTTLGLGGNFLFANTHNVILRFTNMNFFNNSNGGSAIQLITNTSLDDVVQISSTNYTNNVNGGLKLLIATLGASKVTFHRLTVIGNKGTFAEDIIVDNANQGTGILFIMLNSMLPSTVSVSYCNVNDNIGSESSIVYIESISLNINQEVSIVSSNFTNNVGSALYLSNCAVEFRGFVLFINNTAGRGAAMYLNQGSQITVKENTAIKFDRNIAKQWGGAIYIQLSFGCPYNGIVISDLSKTATLLFTDNSAGIAGNSIYFNMPESCDVIRETLIYKFSYSQPPELIGPPIATSPYKVSLCSTRCHPSNEAGEICHVPNRNMLGQSVGINAVVCDYYGNISETVQFYIECNNCNDTYRLSNNKILVHQGSFDVTFLAVDTDSDIVGSTNVTLSLSSVLPDEYRQLSATVSVELSSCQSGYTFDPNLQHCVCYEQTKDKIRCHQDYSEIKYGCWFGVAIPPKHTVSLCPIYYCNFNEETSNGYYMLSEQLGNQCNSHRTGVACGECKSGYTLAYDSPDCINTDKCSTGMTIITVALTILYWTIVVALVFGLMQCKVSFGYAYGLIYYYSIIDILLGSNFYISDGVFQLVTILSSFAKLTPQFLGKLCFVERLSGIDQQFIHYFHALFIFCLIGGIVMAARYSFKIANIVRHCIIRVICLLILLSYTSLASTSLQLLRPLYFDDVNGAYVYSSPSIKYFTGRHILYGIIALLCGLFIVIGLPLLLLLEPFLNHKVSFAKIKPLLDQYQECYKDRYHWFAAYYLVCRQVIIAIIYVSNFNNELYYLQTACIIIVMIHAWIKPYKSETLNIIDGEILLILVFVANLNSFAFSRPLTIFLIVLAVSFPLVLSGCTFVKIHCSFICNKKDETDELEEMQQLSG